MGAPMESVFPWGHSMKRRGLENRRGTPEEDRGCSVLKQCTEQVKKNMFSFFLFVNLIQKKKLQNHLTPRPFSGTFFVFVKISISCQITSQNLQTYIFFSKPRPQRIKWWVLQYHTVFVQRFFDTGVFKFLNIDLVYLQSGQDLKHPGALFVSFLPCDLEVSALWSWVILVVFKHKYLSLFFKCNMYQNS